MKFWVRPTWLEVDDPFCIDEQTFRNETVIGVPKNDTNYSHSIFHKNQVLLYCDIKEFDKYVSSINSSVSDILLIIVPHKGHRYCFYR